MHHLRIECVLQHMGAHKILHDTHFLTHQLRFTFHLKMSSLMYISRKSSSVFPVIHTGKPTILHKIMSPRNAQDTLYTKNCFISANSKIFKKPIFSALGHPIGWTGRISNSESKIGEFVLCRIFQHYNACYLICKSFTKICFQKTCVGYHTLAACQKWVPLSRLLRDWRTQSVRRASWAVVHPSHMCPLLKEPSKNLKIKLPNGTVFTMIIFSQVNTKEYLEHVVAVLCLINQKGLDVLAGS